MKKIIFLFAIIALFFGCTNEENVTNETSNDLKSIAVQTEPIVDGGSFGGSPFRDAVNVVYDNVSASKFYWKTTDVIAVVEDDDAIFSGNGNHHPYQFTSGEADPYPTICSGTFTRLISDKGTVVHGNYIVVYPWALFEEAHYWDNGKLYFTMNPQTQTTNEAYDNFEANDFMYSPSTFVVAQKELDGYITEDLRFTLKHTMSWLQFGISGIPDGDLIRSIAISSPENIFNTSVELSTTLQVTYMDPVNKISLNTNNFEMGSDQLGNPYRCWLTVEDVPGGKPITFTIVTTHYVEGSAPVTRTYTNTLTSNVTFQPNMVYNLNLNVGNMNLTDSPLQ